MDKNGDDVGGISYYFDSDNPETFTIEDLWVIDKRKGHGTYLMEEAIKDAKKRGYKKIELVAVFDDEEDKENLLRFYKRFGLKVDRMVEKSKYDKEHAYMSGVI